MEHFVNSGVGYSRRIDDPEILRGVRKFNWTVRLLFLAVIALPLLLGAVLSGGNIFGWGKRSVPSSSLRFSCGN